MRKYLGWVPIGMIGVTFILLSLMRNKVNWYVDTIVLITGIVLAMVTALLIKNGKCKTIIVTILGILAGGFLLFMWVFC
jgi:uncharacterized membrane-anchored protein